MRELGKFVLSADWPARAGALGREGALLASPHGGGRGSLPPSLRIRGPRITPNPFLLTGSLSGDLSLVQTFNLYLGPGIKAFSFMPNLFYLTQTSKWGPSRTPNFHPLTLPWWLSHTMEGTSFILGLPFRCLNKESSSHPQLHTRLQSGVPSLIPNPHFSTQIPELDVLASSPNP